MRCLTLVRAMKRLKPNLRVIFLVNPEGVELLAPFTSDEMAMGIVGDGREVTDYVSRCQLLIVDHYGLDAEFEGQCRSFAEYIFVIDDLANRQHDCDFLIDATFNRSSEVYEVLNLRAGATYFCGSAWSLVRREFSKLRSPSLEKKAALGPVSHVLVSAGMTDPVNLTSLYLFALKEVGYDAQVDVVLGRQAPYLREVEDQICRDFPNQGRVLKNVKQMAPLLLQTDLVLGASGSSCWERCVMGVPSVLTSIADNQDEICTQLDLAGAALSVGRYDPTKPENLLSGLKQLLASPEKRMRLSRKAAQICEGLGAEKIAERLTEECFANAV